MKTRWILLIGWLVWTGGVVGQEVAVEGDPFAEQEEDVSEVDPFAVAGEAVSECGSCEEEDPFAAEDTDGPDGGEVDPFAGDWNGGLEAPKIPVRRLAEVRTTLRLRLETWELDAKEVARGLDEFGGPEDLEAARQGLLDDDGSVLVFSPVLTLEARSRAKSESLLEKIYPTEAEPPEPVEVVPDKETGGETATVGGLLEAVSAVAVPTAFEVRNTGVTFEAAVQPVAAEQDCWDAAISFEEVRIAAMETQGAEVLQIKMPAVSDFRTGGLLRMKEGVWQLLSVQEPPRGVDGKAGGMSWVTIVRVDRAR